MSKPILYSYFRSSCSYRVRIALALKDIDYDYKSVNLIKDGGEQFSDEYQKLNPEGLVPTFVIDSNVITQSMAILEFLDEKYPQPPNLLPKNIFERSKARAIAQTIASDIQPVQNLRILKFVNEFKPDWAKYWIEIGFKALEKLLVDSDLKYCVGHQVSIADILLAPQVYNALRYNVDLELFPKINAIYKNLMELDAFKKAHPSAQPDCPPELK